MKLTEIQLNSSWFINDSTAHFSSSKWGGRQPHISSFVGLGSKFWFKEEPDYLIFLFSTSCCYKSFLWWLVKWYFMFLIYWLRDQIKQLLLDWPFLLGAVEQWGLHDLYWKYWGPPTGLQKQTWAGDGYAVNARAATCAWKSKFLLKGFMRGKIWWGNTMNQYTVSSFRGFRKSVMLSLRTNDCW